MEFPRSGPWRFLSTPRLRNRHRRLKQLDYTRLLRVTRSSRSRGPEPSNSTASGTDRCKSPVTRIAPKGYIFNGFEGKSTDTTLALISIRRNGVVNKLTHRRRSYSEGCRRRLGLTEHTSLSSRHSPYGSWPSTTPRCVSGCARPAATSIARWQCLTNEYMVHPRGCQPLRFSGRRSARIYTTSLWNRAGSGPRWVSRAVVLIIAATSKGHSQWQASTTRA